MKCWNFNFTKMAVFKTSNWQYRCKDTTRQGHSWVLRVCLQLSLLGDVQQGHVAAEDMLASMPHSSGAYLKRHSLILPRSSYRVSPAFAAALWQAVISAVRNVDSPCKHTKRSPLTEGQTFPPFPPFNPSTHTQPHSCSFPWQQHLDP